LSGVGWVSPPAPPELKRSTFSLVPDKSHQMKRFHSIASTLLLVTVAATAQVPKSKSAQDEPPLVPLTDNERALNFKGIVANQPDFVADEVFFYNEGFGGFSAKQHVARKGNRFFLDTGFVKIILEPDKEIRLNDRNKTFEETPIRREIVIGNGRPIDPTVLPLQPGATFVGLGTQTIDGHKCLKIEAKIPEQDAKVFLYAAEDLKYLIIAAQVLNPPRGSIQRLQNISLNVSASVVEIPSNYRPLAKHKWSRVESASVTIDGKPGEKSCVFRADNGNELFVTLYEPHPATGLMLPWHYLVYLKQQTVEIGFQGLLTTADGKFAWDTSAREAFSNGDDIPDKESYPCHRAPCPKTTVGPNSVQFPSVYYVDRKSMVRVTW
jgi:hypothetical protein